MSDRERIQKSHERDEGVEDVVSVHSDTDEIDELLDEIDSVLEENAEEFVRNYVQKGGE